MRRFQSLFLMFILFMPCGGPARLDAQNFRPLTKLKVLETTYFNIIYPGESEGTALRLASGADAVYERVSGLLDIRVPGRIPVTITPHTDQFNGYMNPLPYPHIVLYDTPMSPEWTVFADSLESLFLHELTHALSLSSRGPAFNFFHALFGGWVMPTALTAPLFMVEGVTVSFESLDGGGRAKDPLVRQRIRQAIMEGTALSPFQASGLYDRPPLGRAYYEYGGLFSAYLQENYGMEKYKDLWAAMGKRIPLSLRLHRSGFFGIFRKVYGVELSDAWQAFLASLALAGVVDAAAAVVAGGEFLIGDISAANGRVYFLETNSRTLRVYDAATGETKTLKDVDGTAYGVSVHPDGTRLLVSAYQYRGALARAIVAEYDAENGRPTGRRWEGLYSASYFRDGIAAKASLRHGSRIVYLEDGSPAESMRDLVPPGNAERVYSAPAALDRDRLAFIVAEGGIRRLGLLDLRSGELQYAAVDLPDGVDRLRHIRSLKSVDGKLLFAYNHDDRMYKLAIVEPDAPEGPAAHFYDRDLSGGVAVPTAAGNHIYYRAEFSTWDALARFPQEPDDTERTTAALRWERSDWSGWSEYAGADSGADSVADGPAERPTPQPYSALKYLNPLKFWIPFPLVQSEDGSLSIDGGGIITYLSDPTDHNTFLINAGGDLRSGGMGYFDTTWASLSFGLPTTLSVSDGMEVDSYADGYLRYRATRISAAALFDRGLGNEDLRFRVQPQASASLLAADPEDGSGVYEWAYDDPRYTIGAGVSLSTLIRRPWQLFGGGAALELLGRAKTDGEGPRWDAVFRTALEPVLPFRATLYGAWDEGGMTIAGKSPDYGQAPFADVAAGEYARDAPRGLAWIAGGELELKLFTLEAQRSFSHLYFNRFFGTLAYRAVLSDGLSNFQSAVLRAGAVISAAPVTLAPVRFSPYAWFALKLSDLYEDWSALPYQAGIALALEW